MGYFLKKPLQAEKDQFLLLRKGQLIGWGQSDVKNLLKMANKAKAENLSLDSEITYKEAECVFTREWFDLFIDEGITKEIIAKLNSRIGHVRFHHVLVHSPKGLPNWRRIANGDEILDTELGIAYCIAHLLASGEFVGLKRCGFKECQKYFIGKTNKKWCSSSCGTHFRVKKMRRNKMKNYTN